jgi:ADP-heptose:LPS heptosyltransferase
VIRPGALGDTLLGLPAVRVLRHAVGESGEVDWVGYPRYLELALNPLHASSIYSVDRSVFSGLFSEPSSNELEIFLASYDWVVYWCRDDSAYFERLSARLKVPAIRSAPYPVTGSGIHAAEHLLRSIEPGADLCAPELVLSEASRAAGERQLRDIGLEPKNFLAIHPGSGDRRKNWSPVAFSRVAELARSAGLKLLIVEGEADEESVRALLDNLDIRPAVLRIENLHVVARVLSQSVAYLGNDSGITHLAAASWAPTVALFGPTDPRTWAPLGRMVRVLGFDSSAESVWEAIQDVRF